MIWAPFTRKQPDELFAIVIYNGNAIKDDNFEVYLNETSIGTIDNNQDAYTGRIFVEPRGVSLLTPSSILLYTITLGGADSNIPITPALFDPTVALNMSLLINGANRLVIESVQNNGSGNYGKIIAAYWKKNAAGKYTRTVPKTRLEDVYLSLSGDRPADKVFQYP